jgi:exosome complex component RRP42
MSSMEVSNLSKDYLKKIFSEGKRFDGRALEEFRELKIEKDVSNKAEGSVRVRLGKTEVVVGVKMELGTPYPDSRDKGNLMVSGDLLPLASPRFEQGPPKFNAIELPRLIDRAVRGSEIIELPKLVVEVGEKVWTVIIDIYPINDDGNLIDASAIGALVALRNAEVPGITAEGNVDYKKKSGKKIPVDESILPLTFTAYKLGDSIIFDPTREEEEACDVRISFGISKWNGQYMVNSGQKTGKTTLSKKELDKIVDLLPGKFDELSEKLKSEF